MIDYLILLNERDSRTKSILTVYLKETCSWDGENLHNGLIAVKSTASRVSCIWHSNRSNEASPDSHLKNVMWKLSSFLCRVSRQKWIPDKWFADIWFTTIDSRLWIHDENATEWAVDVRLMNWSKWRLNCSILWCKRTLEMSVEAGLMQEST